MFVTPPEDELQLTNTEENRIDMAKSLFGLLPEDADLYSAREERLETSELELLRTLTEAAEDVSNNRVAPMQETFDDIRAALLDNRIKS